MRNRRTLRCHNPTANPSTSPPVAIPTTHPPGAILRSKIPAERPATLTRMSRERPPELLREKSTEIPAGRARPCRRRIKPEPARRQSRQTEPNGRQRRFQFEPELSAGPGRSERPVQLLLFAANLVPRIAPQRGVAPPPPRLPQIVTGTRCDLDRRPSRRRIGRREWPLSAARLARPPQSAPSDASLLA